MVNCINLIIEMSPRFILGRENVPCVAEVVNRSLKADCTDFKNCAKYGKGFKIGTNEAYNIKIKIRLGGISKIFCFCSHANIDK